LTWYIPLSNSRAIINQTQAELIHAGCTLQTTLSRLGSKFETVPLDGTSPYVRPASILYELDGEQVKQVVEPAGSVDIGSMWVPWHSMWVPRHSVWVPWVGFLANVLHDCVFCAGSTRQTVEYILFWFFSSVGMDRYCIITQYICCILCVSGSR